MKCNILVTGNVGFETLTRNNKAPARPRLCSTVKTKFKMVTKLLQESVLAAARAYLAQNYSQADLARGAEVNQAYVSHLMKEAWRTDEKLIPERTWRALELFLRVDDVPFNTNVFKLVIGTLHKCKTERCTGLIDAPTGSGKSYAAEFFRMKQAKGTYLIRCAQDMTAKEFVRTLHEVVLDNKHLGKTIAEMRQDIQVVLGQRYDDKPLLIIDEAENMRGTAYGAIKALYDNLKDRVGIVLIGANNYCTTLEKRARKPQRTSDTLNCLPQIWRRFKTNRVVLPSLTDVETVQICKEAGITDKGVIASICEASEYHSDVFDAVKNLKTSSNDE